MVRTAELQVTSIQSWAEQLGAAIAEAHNIVNEMVGVPDMPLTDSEKPIGAESMLIQCSNHAHDLIKRLHDLSARVGRL